MPEYRRFYYPGGCWFFTVVLHDRTSGLLTRHIDDLRLAVSATRTDYPFVIESMVVLPAHLHAIWTLPVGDTDYCTRWRLIKTRFSKAIASGEPRSASRFKRAERGIWQRRFWEHLIRDQRDFDRHVGYCHDNPVKHGLVERPEDWPYSSYHRDARVTVNNRLSQQEGNLPGDDFGEPALPRAIPNSRPSSARR
jgi:putative transposase